MNPIITNNMNYIIIAVLIVFVIYIITIYNRLVVLKTNRENAFSDIDVQLKQRHDLIPQIVNSVKGYMKHEEKILTEITEARSQTMQSKSINDKIKSESNLDKAMMNLFAVAENYPDIKANQNFLQLQSELSDIENKISASRRFFNSATKEYNIFIKTFPSNIVASTFGFSKEEFYEIDKSEKEPVEVKF